LREARNELDDANDFVDMRGRKLSETRHKMESFSDRSSEMTNSAQLLREQYKK